MRLSFDELESIIAAPDFYSDWVGALSTTYAIYLITDTVSGNNMLVQHTEKMDCMADGASMSIPDMAEIRKSRNC